MPQHFATKLHTLLNDPESLLLYFLVDNVTTTS